MNNNKKIYIHGSFMNDNYGDFLLYYLVHNICETYKDNFDFFSADIDKSYDKYCKINRKSKLEGIFKSDLVIFAGGGYFGEPDKRKIYWNLRCLIKHLIPAYCISKRNIPYAIIGVETGPLSFNINKILLKNICNKSQVLSVRNEESKEFLKNIGVKNTILVNPDWIMGTDEKILVQQPKMANEILKTIDTNIKKIFIHLTTKNNGSMENVVDDLITFLKCRKDIYYIIGCDQKRETQEQRATALSEKFEKDRCKVIYYEGPWTLSALLNKVDAIITDKLHVGIVATKFKKEVISVASHSKSLKFYKMIGREEWTQQLKNVKPNETLEKLKKLTFENIEIKNDIFIKAQNNERILKDFLEDNIK